MKLITTVEAGARRGVTSERIRQFIKAGRLRAIRVGPLWLIDENDLDRITPGIPGWPKGRPRKPEATRTA